MKILLLLSIMMLSGCTTIFNPQENRTCNVNIGLSPYSKYYVNYDCHIRIN